MAITLTENAAKQIQSQLAKRGKGLALRIGVKKVGVVQCRVPLFLT
jgi:iron-sulfur cluster assembly protein